MTDAPNAPEDRDPARRRGISAIWLLPLVALAIAGWLGYRTLAAQGPTIAITFKSATGIEAGKTLIKHNDIELGMVQEVIPTPDLNHVIVRAKMNKVAVPHLNQNTKFWVVRPRVSGVSLSGLDTLISGSYIEMDPGPGKPTKAFTGLEVPPVVRSDVPSTTFVLTTNSLGSLGSGSPIFFNGLEAGEVIDYTFNGEDKPITVRISVRKPFDALVHAGTRFWNSSGVSLVSGPEGFTLRFDSLEAVLAGGIAFDTPHDQRTTPPAKPDTVFPLYHDKEDAEEAGQTRLATIMVQFDSSVTGLEPGSPVLLRGMRIGKVLSVRLVLDAKAKTVRVQVVLDFNIDQIGVVNEAAGELGTGKLASDLVALGLRAQLRSGNLLTGQQVVAFDFFPDAPPAHIEMNGAYPEFPTVPSTLDSMTESIQRTLDKLAALPLDQMAKDAHNTLAAASKFLDQASTQTTPLLSSLRQTSEAANSALQSVTAAYGQGSDTPDDVRDLLRQLRATMKSVKVLVDYLDENPESLIRGKAGSP